ncbi:hypothetical protein UAM5_00003 [Ralstonia phage UAM5]|nr:hypothetical protein UAM5_00003 [Ralstonia phage UAM5]
MTPEELRIWTIAFTLIAMMLTVVCYIAWAVERDFKDTRELLAQMDAEED